MKSRFLALIMVGTLLVTSLAGCGSPKKEGETDSGNDEAVVADENTDNTSNVEEGETSITFGIHVANPQEQEAVTYNIVQEFNKKYAGTYKVEFQAADTEKHSTNMKLQAADGTLPELFWMNSGEAPEYAENSYLLDLGEFLEQYPTVSSAIEGSYKEAFQSGIQYGLPYQCNVEGFFYNKDIFKELDIKEPYAGMTFDELKTMIQKCKDAGYVPVAQGCMNSSYAIWGYLAVLDRYGYSDNIYDILDGKGKFNNDDMISCFTKLQELGTAGAFAENMATQEYFDAKELFTSGKAALFNSGAWDCAELDEKLGDKVGFWWGPSFEDSSYSQERSMKVPSAPICVSAKVADDAAKKEAVYKFLEFYYSEDAAKLTYSGSMFPATNYTGIEISDTQYTLNEVVANTDIGWTNPAAQPDQILSSNIQSQLYDSILGVLLGNYTPQQALDKIDEQLNY